MTDVRVAIAGLGRMGAGYPDAAGQPRNHLSAAARADGIRVTALIDSDPIQLRKAGDLPEAAGAKLLDSLDRLPVDAVDVLVDATPSGDRSRAIRQAVACGVDVVILEKPVAASAVEAALLRRTVQNSAVKVRVNFQRRLDPRHLAIRGELKPRPQTVMAAYGKGLQNYGSHLVDLILDWMGPVAEVRANNPWTAEPDPSIGFDLRFADGRQGTVVAPGCTGWDIFEATFLGAFGRVDLINGGARIILRRPVQDLVYKGYTHLEEDSCASSTGAVSGLSELYGALRSHFNAGALLPGATLEEALLGMQVIDAVKRSALAGGTWQSTGSLI